jgi:hypothetical protein
MDKIRGQLLQEKMKFLKSMSLLLNHDPFHRSITRSNIGGERITDLLVGFLADEFNRKYKADPRETKRGWHFRFRLKIQSGNHRDRTSASTLWFLFNSFPHLNMKKAC